MDRTILVIAQSTLATEARRPIGEQTGILAVLRHHASTKEESASARDWP